MIEFIVQYWLETLFACICGLFAFLFKKLFKKIKKYIEKQTAVESGLQALLRNELVRRYREYETKKEISILDMENIEHMFKEYKNLGGNGTVEKMYEELLKLPTKIIKN